MLYLKLSYIKQIGIKKINILYQFKHFATINTVIIILIAWKNNRDTVINNTPLVPDNIYKICVLLLISMLFNSYVLERLNSSN